MMWSSAACILTSTSSSIRFPCALQNRIACIWTPGSMRMQECLKRFVRRGQCPLKELVAKGLSTPAAKEAKNRLGVQDQQGLETTAGVG